MDVFNQYNLITLLAVELDHTTTIDSKLDWRDVRAVISLKNRRGCLASQRRILEKTEW